ncbi:phosphocholine-specific phospholipase C [Caballeronia sp. LZ034LL]|uniref:phosphocholine-specific phospholipase C n=1 Tax=Caballeronia sp. LZ034LL TaxID=3038567 RepID=UPI00285617AD|nr:phospholipase C, phosphocholine-specific [Caballeronia sp. LZ034LL]MDR5833961.1 phospholipase C, phosphocholine-specific [Caballeronia sp. LZ034LL]
MNSRRKFLQSTATAGLSAAALSVFPPSIRRALAIPAHHESGTIKDVKHVVILMMENRAFDHYFGTYKGVRGYGDRFTIPLPDGRNVWQQIDASGNVDLPYHLDETRGNAQRVTGTPHSWVDTQAAWDGGRMAAWPVSKKNQTMGYFDTAEIPFQRALAEAFTICDDYHCAFLGGTHPNRMFHSTGTNGPAYGKTFVNNFTGDYTVASSASAYFDWKTTAERLEEAGVSWKVYQNIINTYGCNPLLGFKKFRQANEALPAARQANASLTQAAEPVYNPADAAAQPLIKGYANTLPTTAADPNTNGTFVEAFADDVKNGRLPEVSWVVPTDVYSEHPGPSSPVQGAWFVQQFLDALTAVPEVWSKTVLLVNFDENDGFFDHVPPAAVPSPNGDGSYAGKTTLSGSELGVEYFTHPYVTRADTGAAPDSQPAAPDGKPYGPGPRVPLWVISPWSRGGWVNSQTFDHTSVLRFLEARFGIKESNISSYRRLINGDLTTAFNFATPNSEPLPTLAGEKSKADADALRATQQALGQIVPDAGRGMPAQANGFRPSRALPYELHASAHVDASSGGVKLLFANTGRQGAVFHVYDKLHLDRLPKRYAVEPGRTLDDLWTPASGDLGKYDLWVLGPNGWHREFKGDLSALKGRRGSNLEIRVGYGTLTGNLHLQLRNDGAGLAQFTVKSNRVYGALQAFPGLPLPGFGRGPSGFDGFAAAGFGAWPAPAPFPRTDSLGPGHTWTVSTGGLLPVALFWNLAQTGFWYDFEITSNTDRSFYRRIAGRMETGRHSVSDPAMGMTDAF